MALPEFQSRELTAEDRLYIFNRATAGMSGAIERWAQRAKSPMTDEELQEALAFEIGHGGGCGPDRPSYDYNSSGLRIWGGWKYPDLNADKTLWQGAATIAMARHVYGIKTPEEYREPSLFDFAQEQL